MSINQIIAEQELAEAFICVRDMAKRAGVDEERAAVVKCLRAWAEHCPEDSATQHAMLNVATDIEKGEHHGP